MLGLCLVVVTCTGCVSQRISFTSEPTNASVYAKGLEWFGGPANWIYKGKTPCEVDVWKIAGSKVFRVTLPSGEERLCYLTRTNSILGKAGLYTGLTGVFGAGIDVMMNEEVIDLDVCYGLLGAAALIAVLDTSLTPAQFHVEFAPLPEEDTSIIPGRQGAVDAFVPTKKPSHPDPLSVE